MLKSLSGDLRKITLLTRLLLTPVDQVRSRLYHSLEREQFPSFRRRHHLAKREEMWEVVVGTVNDWDASECVKEFLEGGGDKEERVEGRTHLIVE